jgi:hypothetical protein
VMVRIPLRNRAKEIRAWALVDDEDAALSELRWCFNHGYAERRERVDGKYVRVSMARVIVGLQRGDPREVDHINGDTLDNRRENLRIVTHAQNGQNIRQLRGSSRHRGVSWRRREGRWCAQAMHGGRVHWLGYFDDEDEAALAAAAFRREHLPYAEE